MQMMKTVEDDARRFKAELGSDSGTNGWPVAAAKHALPEMIGSRQKLDLRLGCLDMPGVPQRRCLQASLHKFSINLVSILFRHKTSHRHHPITVVILTRQHNAITSRFDPPAIIVQ